MKIQKTETEKQMASLANSIKHLSEESTTTSHEICAKRE